MTLKIGTKVQINAANTIFHQDKGVITNKTAPNEFEVTLETTTLPTRWGAWMLQEVNPHAQN